MTSSEGNYLIMNDGLGYEYLHFKEQNSEKFPDVE